MSASGSASSTTRSAISGGAITITDGAKQQQLTGQTAAETVASINRDTSNTGGALAPIFDKDKIQAGFEIASQFINQVGTFVSNRVQEADAKRKDADRLEKQAADPDASLTESQRQQLWEQAQQARAEAIDVESKWGAGGTYRQIANALAAAAGGNVTGGSAQFMQSAVVNYVQQQGAAYIGKLVADGVVKEGSPEHAGLHAIVACAGAAASSQNCGAGALGAAASSLLTNLFTDDPNATNAGKDTKRNLVTSLVAGVAALVSPDNAAAAATAAIAAADNNWLTPKQRIERDQKLANCTTDACRKLVKDQYAKLWQSNRDRATNCSSVKSCLDVVDELRTAQREAGERTNELLAKLKDTGKLTTDETAELYTLQRGGESMQGMSSLALHNAVKFGGAEVLQSRQASYPITDVLIGAVSSVGHSEVSSKKPHQEETHRANNNSDPVAENALSNAFGKERSYWKEEPIKFNGNKVYQRDDLINPKYVDTKSGMTNLELMQAGRAPIGPDGKPVNLHHMLQSQDGPIAEVTQTFHQQNYSAIHINAGTDIPSGIDRSQFNAWRVKYWKNRANDFS
ncbi:HNH/ENDO VII family nuclease [Ralstonia pseudosolanacearum]|uniref:HNH/ENDO VII family nuclease n=1 Tax=Ralstonia pseudosolanacearum TaxID=1310165 RepID=UPI00399D6D80